jgi:hypothetical protein
MAKPTSKPLTFFSEITLALAGGAAAAGAPAAGRAVVAAAVAAAAAAGADAGRADGGGGAPVAGRAGAEAGAAALAAGRATLAAGAPGGGGVIGRGAATGAAAPVAGGGGPPAGNVGNLMVAVGFGGKLMRTVCFFEGSGAGAAGGTLGGLSAIKLNCFVQASFDLFQCQTLNPSAKKRADKSLCRPALEKRKILSDVPDALRDIRRDPHDNHRSDAGRALPGDVQY